jgi:hypothetical protein
MLISLLSFYAEASVLPLRFSSILSASIISSVYFNASKSHQGARITALDQPELEYQQQTTLQWFAFLTVSSVIAFMHKWF